MHLIAVEGSLKSSGCRTPDLGDMWRYGCPKSPKWESEDEAWSEDASVPSSFSRENNVCNGALHVIRLYGSGDKVSLPGGLGACGGIKLSHCPVYVAPGRAVTMKERDVVREMKGKRKEAVF